MVASKLKTKAEGNIVQPKLRGFLSFLSLGYVVICGSIALPDTLVKELALGINVLPTTHFPNLTAPLDADSLKRTINLLIYFVLSY